MTLVSINTTSSFHLLVVHTDTISDSLFLCVCSECFFFYCLFVSFFFVIVIVVVLFLLLFVCFPQSVLDFHLLLSHWQDKQVQNQLTSCLPLWCCKDRTGTAVSFWKYQGEKKHDEIKVISSFNKLNWGRRQKGKKNPNSSVRMAARNLRKMMRQWTCSLHRDISHNNLNRIVNEERPRS